MATHVFVLGLDDFNLRKLASIRRADACTFHGLLDVEALKNAEEYPFRELLAQAERTLDDFPGRIDGIVNYWDFPASAIHALLCERQGLPGPSLESVLKCQHKYLSRIEQRRVVPEHVPRFHAFDPFDEDALSEIPLEYPFWIKPVLSYSGYLGFRIPDADTFRDRVARIRDGIARYADPFNELMEHAHLPSEASRVHAGYCIAEEIIGGTQCTVEGYAADGDVRTYGIIDSHRYPNGVSFSRYQYPSTLPGGVQQRIDEATRKLVRHVGYSNAAFNVEFFHDADTDDLKLLEINARISQSHSDLFEKVDGRSNHEAAVATALGDRPVMPRREGAFNVAAKCFVRRFEDGIVRHAPTREEIARVQARFPGTHVVVPVKEGRRLSDILDQDSYSHQIAIVYTGAESEDALMEKQRAIEEALNFDITPVTGAPGAR